ncbi:HpcH/HpaI aldolase/citrate lyase family protein [Herbidospora mongoliensis]|uniref:HpcH/HpaI aldolase/citrate lyase family protein n=1 Tax=Herbidospora mongoliensis TaxID=688067 RepID=UPI00082BBE9A|nr:CoA ester lyase [Herbidospora mongoliensis]
MVRAALFVPGDRPDRFAKAAAAGADLIILDLEDAVAPAAKITARSQVRAWLAGGGSGMVRINARGTTWHADDVALVEEFGCPVMIPKTESAGDVFGTAYPLIETATGLLHTREICAAPGVVRPAFGSVDLAAQLGVDPADRMALWHARSALVLAAASAGVGSPLDGVTTDLTSSETLREDAAHAASLGFGGKLCIHPKQVGPVRDAFTPSAENLAWAEEVMAAATGGVAVVRGQMIDKPVVDRARRLLRSGGNPDGARLRNG